MEEVWYNHNELICYIFRTRTSYCSVGLCTQYKGHLVHLVVVDVVVVAVVAVVGLVVVAC